MGSLPKRWILLFLFLAGCVRIPEHELAVQESSSGIEATVQAALQSGSFEEGEWLLEKWWERFGEPVLTQLIEKGLECNPDLKLAEERLKAATQVALQKRAALFPEIDLDADDLWQHFSKEGFFREYGGNLIPAAVNDIVIGLSFHYEFDFWGKNLDLYRAAMGEAAARLAEMLQAKLVMTTAIAYTYFELKFLLKKLEILEERKKARSSVFGVRQMRQEYALDTAIQTLASEGSDLEIEADLKETHIAIDRQVHKLKALAGMQQDTPIEVVATQLNPIQLKLPKTLGLDLLARRPDLIAQKKQVEAAAKKIDAAKTNFYPNVNLMAFFGTDSVFWSGLFRAHNWDISANPAIHLPIFTAGRIRAELYEKVSSFNEAVYVYNSLIIQAAKEVSDSLTTIASLLKEIEIYQKIYDVSAKEEAHVMRLFLGALVSRVETLDATDDVLHKKLILTEIEYAAQLAEIDLIRSLGGGFHE